MERAENKQFIEALSQSQIYQDYERAFTKTTGLPLSLRPVESFQRAHGGKKSENPFCLLMAETTVLIGADATAEGTVIALALTAAVACVMAPRLPSGVPAKAALGSAVALSALPVGLGYLLFCRGVMPSFKAFGWDRPIDWTYSLAMTLTSACLAASARRREPRWLIS